MNDNNVDGNDDNSNTSNLPRTLVAKQLIIPQPGLKTYKVLLLSTTPISKQRMMKLKAQKAMLCNLLSFHNDNKINDSNVDGNVDDDDDDDNIQ